MEFRGKLGKYKIIATEDQTETLWSEYFDEAFHNLSGAYQETLHNYILGCDLPEKIRRDPSLAVLDVGFGLGVGLKALVLALNAHMPPSANKVLSYTSIELDEELCRWSLSQTFPEMDYKKEEWGYSSRVMINAQNFLEVAIYIGDGRESLPRHASSLPKFTAIFQDAFSPKKNPALWTQEWFSFLKSASHESVSLSTYSSSISIRKSLLAAGWTIENAKGFGQKRTMTKARLMGMTDPLLEESLQKSPILPLKDNSLK